MRFSDLVESEGINDLDLAERLVKEAMQEVILYSLDRSGFFEKALFHGGTCLRILHGLDRFSEDLDFTLLRPEPDFCFDMYASRIEDEFESQGLQTTI